MLASRLHGNLTSVIMYCIDTKVQENFLLQRSLEATSYKYVRSSFCLGIELSKRCVEETPLLKKYVLSQQ